MGDVMAADAAAAATDAAAASAPRGPARVVMLDDTSTNRNAGPANGTEPETTGNNRAGCTSARQNSPRCALGAGPRTPPQTQLEP